MRKKRGEDERERVGDDWGQAGSRQSDTRGSRKQEAGSRKTTLSRFDVYRDVSVSSASISLCCDQSEQGL
ncbi:hypothetical protein STEG23_028049 [Scotinomys teguina]